MQTREPDDLILIQAAQEDREAFGVLYERYVGRIYTYIYYRTGNAFDAEDLTERVFIRALHHIGNYHDRGLPFSAWLYRIAHNQVVDHLRKKSKRLTVPLDENLPAKGEDPRRSIEQKIEIEEIVAAAKGLTRAQQEVISLRFAGELSVAECAKTMGKSEGAVKALQHSAILALRKALGREAQNEQG